MRKGVKIALIIGLICIAGFLELIVFRFFLGPEGMPCGESVGPHFVVCPSGYYCDTSPGGKGYASSTGDGVPIVGWTGICKKNK